MSCLPKAYRQTPSGKKFAGLVSDALANKRLTFEKISSLYSFLLAMEEPKPKAVVVLQGSLAQILKDGQLSAVGYVDALHAIRKCLPPDLRLEYGLAGPGGVGVVSSMREDYARDEETASLLNPPSDRQITYIEHLGGKVPRFLSATRASNLIEKLKEDDWRVERASHLYAQESPASENQKIFIERLGGTLRKGATEAEASELIDRLMKNDWRMRRLESIPYPPSYRQRMVFRFWNVAMLISKAEAIEWQDKFYGDDPDRKAAWELWKKENREANYSNDPDQVPCGVGNEYLKRIKGLDWVAPSVSNVVSSVAGEAVGVSNSAVPQEVPPSWWKKLLRWRRTIS